MTKHEEAQQHIESFLRALPFSYESIEFKTEGGSTIWCAVSSRDSHLLIGRGGETLQAINHMVRKLTEKILSTENDDTAIIVDVNGFHRKKVESLKTVAHMMAERARYFKSSVDVDPMSAFERRIVHEFLSSAPDIKTESVGEGKNRHIVIRYVDSRI